MSGQDRVLVKYKKGTQTYPIGEANTKIRFYDTEGFSEWVWGFRDTNGDVVLLNDALMTTPYRSWGMIAPKKTDADTVMKITEYVLHPEAWELYIANKIIDENGNILNT